MPFAVLNEDGCFLMTDIPANVFKIISGRRLINLQGKIFTAKCIALLTDITHRSSAQVKFRNSGT